ncbi:hypothetical protein SBOR_7506 [Sclerotinia borealis F-4128]|uniref:Uncharacterized protein n=1 Tax=Sclerotinia borealis (strain F-4128) TaxID=1432307 RepID=W9C5U0_SCLBF|nr:hypothetical protein SBOR_7506 [Sclerotinia borealis F-4128]
MVPGVDGQEVMRRVMIMELQELRGSPMTSLEYSSLICLIRFLGNCGATSVEDFDVDGLRYVGQTLRGYGLLAYEYGAVDAVVAKAIWIWGRNLHGGCWYTCGEGDVWDGDGKSGGKGGGKGGGEESHIFLLWLLYLLDIVCFVRAQEVLRVGRNIRDLVRFRIFCVWIMFWEDQVEEEKHFLLSKETLNLTPQGQTL